MVASFSREGWLKLAKVTTPSLKAGVGVGSSRRPGRNGAATGPSRQMVSVNSSWSPGAAVPSACST